MTNRFVQFIRIEDSMGLKWVNEITEMNGGTSYLFGYPSNGNNF